MNEGWSVLPLLLAEGAALELSWGAIVGTVATAIFGGGGGLKLVWGYWTKREDEKRKAWKLVVDDKDDLIRGKDERIEELSKDLSRKSDQHAEKIEELMTLVVDKVEAWSGKLESVLDRSLKVQAEFTAEVREFTEALRELRPDRGTDA